MPNTLINQLTSSRKDLELHQEKLFNNKLLIKRAKFANFQVLYLPDLCKNLPWNIIDHDFIWSHVQNTVTIANYQQSMHKLYRTFKQFIDMHSLYYLKYINGMNTIHIPLIKDNVRQFIIDQAKFYKLTPELIDKVKHYLDYETYSSITGYFGKADLTEFNHMIHFYHMLRKDRWESSYRLNDWLKQNSNKQLYYVDNSHNAAFNFAQPDNTIKSSKVYLISNFNVDNYLDTLDFGLNDQQVMPKRVIKNRINNVGIVDNCKETILSVYKLNHNIWINPSKYEVFDYITMDKVLNENLTKCICNTIICINSFGHKPKYYLGSDSNYLLFEL